MNLTDFLQMNNLRNTWIEEHSIKVYVRKSIRYINDAPFRFLDLASVEVEEDHRGCGIFTEFLNRFEREAKGVERGVYVESILNKRLIGFLKDRGYYFVPGTNEICPTMYKSLDSL
jgi:GNAT superfamily N-acetyltransferase